MVIEVKFYRRSDATKETMFKVIVSVPVTKGKAVAILKAYNLFAQRKQLHTSEIIKLYNVETKEK